MLSIAQRLPPIFPLTLVTLPKLVAQTPSLEPNGIKGLH